jgi:transposase
MTFGRALLPVHSAHVGQELEVHYRYHPYATHKTPAVQRWLKRHPRFHLHFTPTSGSWLNMVERFFAEITRKRIRRGVFKSVDELKQDDAPGISWHGDLI